MIDGADRVPMPAGCGELWLCGKHVVAPDPERARAQIAPGATVVCLNELGDIARYEAYQEWLRTSPDAIWFPMPDFDAPPLDEVVPLVEEITAKLLDGDDVIVHCSAGIGRTGTTAICVLIGLGTPADEARRIVREARPGAGPQAGPQTDLVDAYAIRQAAIDGDSRPQASATSSYERRRS